MFKQKKRYIAVYVVKEQEIRTVLAKRKFKPTSEMLRFNKKTYPIDLSFPTYMSGLKMFYFIDIRDGQVLLNEATNESIINPEILDIILSRKIVAQLTQNLTGSERSLKMITNFLMGAIMGALVGFIIGGYVI